MKQFIPVVLILLSTHCLGQKLQTLYPRTVDTGSYFAGTENNAGSFTTYRFGVKQLVQYLLGVFDTSHSGNLMTVLQTGDTSSLGFKIGKFGSARKFNSLVTGLNVTDSSGFISINDSGATVSGNDIHISASPMDSTYFDVPIHVPYIVGYGGAPILTLLPAAVGSSATGSITGTDGSGYITINTSGAITLGSSAIAIISFSHTHTAVPRYVTFTPANTLTAQTSASNVFYAFYPAINAGAYQLNQIGNLASGNTYMWFYKVEQ